MQEVEKNRINSETPGFGVPGPDGESNGQENGTFTGNWGYWDSIGIVSIPSENQMGDVELGLYAQRGTVQTFPRTGHTGDALEWLRDASGLFSRA